MLKKYDDTGLKKKKVKISFLIFIFYMILSFSCLILQFALPYPYSRDMLMFALLFQIIMIQVKPKRWLGDD